MDKAEPNSEQTPEHADPSQGPRVRRRRTLWTLLLLLSSAGLLGLVYYWPRPALPVASPPTVDLQGLDPAVAEKVLAAQQEIDSDPSSANAWGTLGQIYWAHGYLEPAAECFRTAENLDEKDPRWPYLLGLSLELKTPEAALPVMRRSDDRCDRDDMECLAVKMRLGELLIRLGRLDEAESLFGDVLAIEPNDGRAWFNLGVIAQSKGDYQASVDRFVKCEGSPFAQKKAAVQLAAAFQRLGQRQPAANFVRIAEQLPDDLPWVDPILSRTSRFEAGRQALLAEVGKLEAEGKNAQAAQILFGLAKSSPDAHVLVSLGTLLVKGGQYIQAEQVLRAAIDLDPKRTQAYYALAVAIYNQAESSNPAGTSDTTSEANGESEEKPSSRKSPEARYQEVVQLLRQAVTLKPDFADAYLYLGLAHGKLGERDESLTALRQAVVRRPDFYYAHLELAKALLDDGQTPQAKSELKHAVRLAPPGDRAAEKLLSELDSQADAPESE